MQSQRCSPQCTFLRSAEFSTLAENDTAPILLFFFKSNKGNYNRINRFFFSLHKVQLSHIRESIIADLWLDEFLLYMEMY